MEDKKSSTWEKVWLSVVVLTFGIPVIPIGLVWGYSALTSSPNTEATIVESANTSTSSSSYDEPADTSSGYVESRGSSECTSDCSGHEAGYEWASEHDICDTEYDNGNSQSFNEGVRAWAGGSRGR